MAKELKLWNGRCHSGKYSQHTVYVGAYSRAEAVRIMLTAGILHVTSSEVANYYSEGAWGNDMVQYIEDKPCVWVKPKELNSKPVKIY